MKNFNEFIENLSNKIKASYEENVTLDDAEKLAAEFLCAQIILSDKLRKCDLDAKMRKTGVESISAAIRLEASKAELKKPSEGALDAMVAVNELVQNERNSLSEAETERNNLQRYFDIFT